MNYERVYNEFIEHHKKLNEKLLFNNDNFKKIKYNQRYKVRVFLSEYIGYTECHHVVPRSMGGSDEAVNLVYLSATNHIHAHILLGKIYGGKQWAAIQYIMGNHKKYKHIPTKSMIKNAAMAKVKYTQSIQGTNNPMFGKKASKETIVKLKASHTKERRDRARKTYQDNIEQNLKSMRKAVANRNYNHTDKMKKHIGDIQRGRKASEKTKKKMSDAHCGDKHPMYGKHHSEDTKKKMSDARKGKPLSQSAKDKISGINSVGARKIKCVNTGEVFISILDAAKHFGLNNKSVGHCARRNTPMNNGLDFEFV